MLYSRKSNKLRCRLYVRLFAALYAAVLTLSLVSCGSGMDGFKGNSSKELTEYFEKSRRYEVFREPETENIIDIFDNVSDEEKQRSREDKASGEDEKPLKYVVNTKSHKLHLSSCGAVSTIKDENRAETESIDEYLQEDFEKCALCMPEE